MCVNMYTSLKQRDIKTHTSTYVTTHKIHLHVSEYHKQAASNPSLKTCGLFQLNPT
jgi:hypothetical protein